MRWRDENIMTKTGIEWLRTRKQKIANATRGRFADEERDGARKRARERVR